MSVPAVGNSQVVTLLERPDRADRHRFLPLTKMRRALDLPLHEQFLDLVLEQPDLDHPVDRADPVPRTALFHDLASLTPVPPQSSVSGFSSACLNVPRNLAASTPS